ncbi:methyl-accepting chemotaxis protein [Paucibacter sp. APW11]|uniref:Methyl-accepting chemotaxis protein n=1 Tax=Roseateles aquae TaxID=3077235 RepID=A0ABU3PDX7_9BURK|nr:methyl-accepting chemotaxis protein [Paucibacter sp. APW11]MDT9000797.1 methyl-accepting chemotaxis protein [Paucibacter sp. APW11]
MKAMSNLKIGTRLTLGFGLMLAIIVGMAGAGLHGMNSSRASLHEITRDNVPKMMLVGDMSESVHIVSRVMRTIILLDDKSKIESELKKLQDYRAKYNQASDALDKLPGSPQGLALRAKIKAAASEARTLNDQVLALAAANKDAEARELLLSRAAPATQAWQDAMDENIELQKLNNAEDEASATAAGDEVRNELALMVIAALALGASVAWLITRSIVRPIERAVEVARTVAAGDLSSEIEIVGRDEPAQLLQALAEMNDSLARVVSTVREGSESVATASSQIASGNTDLSQRTEEQAANLQQTAASMEQINATVRNSADTAAQATQLAGSASAVARQGGEVISQVISTMSEINSSSQKIADIIGVMDSIAFQTNILALNAAVEAARAGEQGRGFAVVAGEVRALAHRSAASAKEIKTLINESVAKVEAGTRLVSSAGETMGEIVSQVRRVNDLIDEISSATVEQTSGVGQISDAVGQLDQVTQQNAALVEESAAAAESLNQQATRLVDAVRIFKLRTELSALSLAPRAEPGPAARPARLARPERPAQLAKQAIAKAASSASQPRSLSSNATQAEWASF